MHRRRAAGLSVRGPIFAAMHAVHRRRAAGLSVRGPIFAAMHAVRDVGACVHACVVARACAPARESHACVLASARRGGACAAPLRLCNAAAPWQLQVHIALPAFRIRTWDGGR
jgi:hypothetical protein